MGARPSAPISPESISTKPPVGTPIYRRDLKDRKIIESLISREAERVKNSLNRNPELDDVHLKAYATACWDAYRSLSELYVSESHAYNSKFDLDLDHWYEINLANPVLFDNLRLDGMEELLPGRLFTTRMPRNIKTDPDSAKRFVSKCKEFHLHTVLILTEKEEYEKYAGADLEEFYNSLGLEVIHRPIADFTIPNQPDMIQNIKDITWRLLDGKNCLIHCAGGNGRTGMVVAGVVKNIGVHDPISWVRRVKTQYVETTEQENFVKSITPVLDNRLAQKFPVLAKCITAEHILDMYKHDGLKGLASRRSSMNTIPIELASVASISPQTSHPHFPAVNQSNLSNVSDVSKGSSNNSAHLNNHESTSGHTPTRMVPGVAGAPMRTFSVESFNTSSSPGSMNNLHKAGVGMPSTTSLEDEDLDEDELELFSKAPKANCLMNPEPEELDPNDAVRSFKGEESDALTFSKSSLSSRVSSRKYRRASVDRKENDDDNNQTIIRTKIVDVDDPNDEILDRNSHNAFYGKKLLSNWQSERLTHIDFGMAFDLINTSHSEYITVKELFNLFKTLGANLSQNQVDRIMATMDGDGRIGREDFELLMRSNSVKM